jgi:hypothetical protein
VGIAAAIIFTCNALMLEYAISGLHITLYVFLTTSLLLVLYNLARLSLEEPSGIDAGRIRWQAMLAGILTGALYLTEPVFFWFIPVMLIGIAWLIPASSGQRYRTLGWFILPVLVLVVPWMVRNWKVSGNPIFALRGLEVWMYTNTYPGQYAYRMAPEDLAPGSQLLTDVVKKLLLGAGQVVQAFPQVTASWVLAFFLPSLLFDFTSPATNRVRRMLMFCFLAVFIGTLLFGLHMPLFTCTIPTMLVFSVAFLLHLIQQARLSRYSTVLTTLLLGGAVIYPLLSDVALTPKRQASRHVAAAKDLGQLAKRDDVMLSDQPWLTAWYADRPSVWIPASDRQVSDLRKQFSSARWLFLTEQVQGFSDGWRTVYGLFSQWNYEYKQTTTVKKPQPLRITVSEKSSPLAHALNGFVSVEPGQSSAAASVLATYVNDANSRVSLRSDRSKKL